MPTLSTHHLSLTLGTRRLVTGLDWQVQVGELWCVLGRNGAGKSTLLHALAGLQRIDQGEILLTGHPLNNLSLAELAQLRGLMPQQMIDHFSCSVGEAVAIALAPWRVGHPRRDERDYDDVADALQRVGMLDRIDDDITQLSGGERQRVAFAATLVQNPTLMLFDEPTSHQDIAQQRLLMRLMQQLAADHAVIASCHDINLAARFATHGLLLGDGFYYAGDIQQALNPEILSRVFGCEFEGNSQAIVAV